MKIDERVSAILAELSRTALSDYDAHEAMSWYQNAKSDGLGGSGRQTYADIAQNSVFRSAREGRLSRAELFEGVVTSVLASGDDRVALRRRLMGAIRASVAWIAVIDAAAVGSIEQTPSDGFHPEGSCRERCGYSGPEGNCQLGRAGTAPCWRVRKNGVIRHFCTEFCRDRALKKDAEHDCDKIGIHGR